MTDFTHKNRDFGQLTHNGANYGISWMANLYITALEVSYSLKGEDWR